MAKGILVMCGTSKGAFLFRSQAGGAFSQTGPFLAECEVNHVTLDPRDGSLLAAANSPFYGPAVRRSTDLGATWERGGEGLAYAAGDEESVSRVWHILPGPADRPDEIYAGVEASGLFRTTDGGSTWHEVAALREHPTHVDWGAGNGGKCLHTIALDPFRPGRIFTACSSGGLYRSDDLGETWTPRNRGLRAEFMPEDQQYPEVGQCVHKFSLSPTRKDRAYLQNHGGVYRSDDGGDSWIYIADGLPSDFGFPVLAHPRHEDTAFVIPIERLGRYAPDGELCVWRTDDAGASWRPLRSGLADGVYVTVLRDAFSTDGHDPLGLYLGTASGSVFASLDEGEHWQEIGRHLPRILSVEAAVLDV